MFKKATAVAFKGETKLRGKERKRLREALEARFGGEEGADALLPAKADVVVKKVGGGSSAQFYFVDGECFFVQPDSRDDVLETELLPTLSALWRAGDATLAVPVVLIQRPVAKFVFRGADVMAPGVHSVVPQGGADEAPARPLPTIGAVVAVCCVGNPSACAVGRLKAPAASLAGGASKGEAVEVLHFFGDALWEACGSRRPAGFVGDEVRATEEPAAASADVGAAGGRADAPPTSFAPPARSCADAAGAADEQAEDAADAAQDESSEQQTPEAMSKAMEECLLQAIKTRVKDKDLPIAGNALYAQHLRPCRRAGTNIDVKTSSFKKLVTFLAHCEESGWIALKKNSPEPVVTKIFRDHPDVIEWKPWPRSATAEAEQSSGAGGSSGAVASIEVQPVWRVGAKAKPLLEALGGEGPGAPEDGCWSREECAQVCRLYADKKQLWAPNNKKRLAPDAVLQGLLGAAAGGANLSLDGLVEQVLGGMKPAHRVAAPQGGAVGGIRRTVRDGKPPVVRVRTDTRKGHSVTLVHGLEAYGVDLEAFASCLTKALATSVAVEEAAPTVEPGIMVQGFWDVAVVAWLGKVGVPTESVQHQAKKGQTQKKAKQATNIVKH